MSVPPCKIGNRNAHCDSGYSLINLDLTEEEANKDIPPERRVTFVVNNKNICYDVTDLYEWFRTNPQATVPGSFGSCSLSPSQKQSIIDRAEQFVEAKPQSPAFNFYGEPSFEELTGESDITYHPGGEMTAQAPDYLFEEGYTGAWDQGEEELEEDALSVAPLQHLFIEGLGNVGVRSLYAGPICSLMVEGPLDLPLSQQVRVKLTSNLDDVWNEWLRNDARDFYDNDLQVLMEEEGLSIQQARQELPMDEEWANSYKHSEYYNGPVTITVSVTANNANSSLKKKMVSFADEYFRLTGDCSEEFGEFEGVRYVNDATGATASSLNSLLNTL